MAEYIYDAWGNHKVINHTSENIGDVNPFRYRGYYFDKETNLYYLNSRYYSSEIGRFISPDEFSILDETKAQINGLNLYMYCMDNPIMMTDDNGFAPKWWNPFSLFDNVGNVGKIIIGAVALVGAAVLTVATGGALLPLMTGFADGVLWGGIFALASSTVSAIKAVHSAKQGITIGKGMDRVRAAAKLNNTATYKPMKGYNLIKKFFPKLADKLSIYHNKIWINRMMNLNAKIFNIGLGNSSKAGLWYGMELNEIAKRCYHVINIIY